MLIGTFDGSIHSFDIKSKHSSPLPISNTPKICSMDASGDLVVAAFSDGFARAYDLRNPSVPLDERGMKDGRITCIRLHPHTAMAAYGLSEGRVCIWYLGNALANKSYTFRTQRRINTQSKTVYVHSVDALTFCPDGDLITGGCIFSYYYSSSCYLWLFICLLLLLLFHLTLFSIPICSLSFLSYLYLQTYTYIYILIYIYPLVFLSIYFYLYLYPYIYIYIFIFIYIYIYLYLFIFIYLFFTRW